VVLSKKKQDKSEQLFARHHFVREADMLYHFDQFSIGTIVQVILLACITGYFLSLQNKSRPTWLMTLFFAGLTLGFASLAVVYTLVTSLWLVFSESMWIFLLLAFVAILQFPYHYPYPYRQSEARIVLGLSILFVVIFTLATIRVVLLPASYTQNHDLTAVVFLGVNIFWFIFTMLRRAIHASAPTQPVSSGERFRTWIRVIARPEKRAAKMLVGFALTMFIPISILVVEAISIGGFISSEAVTYFYQIVMMIFLLTLAFVYVNNAPEPTTFLVKIVGVSFVLMMTVVTALLTIALPAYEKNYNEARKLEVQLVEAKLDNTDFSQMPEGLRYVISQPAPADFDHPNYTLHYASDPSFTVDSPWFGPNSLVATNSTQFAVIFTELIFGDRYNRTIDLTESTTRYTVYFFQHGGNIYEVGYDYADFVHATQPDGANILLLIIGATIFLVFGFRIFLHPSLIAPLEKLVDGMKRVNENDLSVEVQIHAADEIGFLTGSFNEMVRSLYEAAAFKESVQHELETEVGERTRQPKEARDAVHASGSAEQ